MILPDVNVLVYSYRADAPGHAAYRAWLEEAVNAEAPFGISDLILSGFVRIVTHSSIFDPPTPLDEALKVPIDLKNLPNCVPIAPGRRHWDIFIRLCRESGARGNLVADAFIAALAIESGTELITSDRDFARFPGLRWRHPLAG